MANDRRDFLKKFGGSMALVGMGSSLGSQAGPNIIELKSNLVTAANDRIRIGLIGAGIIGHYDTDTALLVEGVELVAVCDLYSGRLDFAREKWGKSMYVTKDYREILAMSDIDAVLICTPDHWHEKISIDAMNAGKHVYCEKPMIQKLGEGHAIINTQKATGKVFQVGSQRASSVAVLEAKKVLDSGMIGELTYAQAYCDRSDARGAWQYSIPTDASPATVDFDTFLGNTPKIPFDATRFFRWRNYREYGTGAAGDLVVHLLTSIHVITDSYGPDKIMAMGELKYWKDGRDAYDIINALMSYPKSPNHDSFQVYTRVNLCDGGGNGGFGLKIFGTDGVIDVGWNEFKVTTLKRRAEPGFGGYDAFYSFSAKQKKDFKKWYAVTYGAGQGGIEMGKEVLFEAPKGYDDRLDHFKVFFNGIRTGSTIPEDASFGLRSAAPSLACNESIALQKPILWDPVGMKVI